MVQLLHPRVLVASLVLLVAAIGCAHPKPAPAPMVYRPAPPPPLPPPPPPKKVKLVVLPLDKLALPGTAEDLNAKLAQVKLPGAEDAVMATVSMETAQLQSECSDPSETCYLKIARLVEADRLLWAQVEKVSGKGKKKSKKPSTRIQIVLFDREKLAVAGRSDESFAGPISGEVMDKLISTATGVRPGPAAAPDNVAPHAATPPPVASPAPAYAPPPPAAYPAATAAQPAARPAYAPQPTQPAAPAARQPAQQPAPAPAGYRQPAPAQQPAYASPPAAAPQPAYAPPAASPPPAAAPPPPAYAPPAASPPPAYAPPAASPPPASAPMPARWQ